MLTDRKVFFIYLMIFILPVLFTGFLFSFILFLSMCPIGLILLEFVFLLRLIIRVL